MKKALFAACSLALSSTAAFAQTTYLVGPGGFPQINDAIAVAAPGDVILVQPGTCIGVSISIGVTLRGLGAVSLPSLNAVLPAGQSLHLVNIKTSFLHWLNGGTVTMDSCSAGTFFWAHNTTLTMQSCTLNSTFSASSSYVSSVDCTFLGQASAFDHGSPGPARAAVALQDSTFLASFVTCVGGGGLSEPAVVATNSTVWISDSTLSSGAPCCGATVPCPVVAQAGGLTRCTLTPSCTPAVATTGQLLGVHRTNPFTSPGPFQLEFRTEPNALVAVWASTSLGNLLVPGIPQALLLDAPSLFLCEVLVANTNGIATNTWELPAGLTNQTFWFQGLGIDTTLQLSPITGGVVR